MVSLFYENCEGQSLQSLIKSAQQYGIISSVDFYNLFKVKAQTKQDNCLKNEELLTLHENWVQQVTEISKLVEQGRTYDSLNDEEKNKFAKLKGYVDSSYINGEFSKPTTNIIIFFGK